MEHHSDTYSRNSFLFQLTYDVAFQDVLQLLMFNEKETFLGQLDFPESVTSQLLADLDSTVTGLTWLSDITRYNPG